MLRWCWFWFFLFRFTYLLRKVIWGQRCWSCLCISLWLRRERKYGVNKIIWMTLSQLVISHFSNLNIFELKYFQSLFPSEQCHRTCTWVNTDKCVTNRRGQLSQSCAVLQPAVLCNPNTSAWVRLLPEAAGASDNYSGRWEVKPRHIRKMKHIPLTLAGQ